MSSGAAELTRAVEAVAVARACVEALRRGVTQGKIACPLPTEEALPALVGAGLALGVDDVVYGTERDWPVALGEEGGVQAVVSSIVNPSSDGSERFGTRIGRFVMMETGTAAYVAAAVGRGIAAARGTGRGVVICLIGAGTMALPEWGAAWQVAVAEGARLIVLARGPLGGLPGAGAERVEGRLASAVATALGEARGGAVWPRWIDARTAAVAGLEDRQALQAVAAQDAQSEARLRANVSEMIAEVEQIVSGGRA